MPLKKLTPFAGDYAAGTGTATLDVLTNVAGKIINRIIVALSGNAAHTKASHTAVKVTASDNDKGGKLLVDTTGSRNDSRMQFRGIAATAAFYTVDFTEIRAKTIKGQKLGSVDTRLLKTLDLEIVMAGAVAATLAAYVDFDEPSDYDGLYDKVERALIGKVRGQQYNFAAAGDFPVKIPFGHVGGSLIKRVFFHGATVTGALVYKNGRIVYQTPTDALNDYVQTEYGRTPQANIFAIDFIQDGNLSGAMNAAAAESMEWYVTVSGAGNVFVEVEMLDPMANH